MSNSTLKILPALIVTITAAWVAQPVFGSIEHQIVLTENSPVSLSATFDGSASGITVLNTAPDQWTVELSLGITGTPQAQWIEPENSGLVNLVQNTSPSNGVVHVVSDTSPLPGLASSVDGSSVPFGSDASDGVAIVAVYHDKAATSEVPEPGTTTCLIFGLSLGLVFVRRRLC